MPIYEYGCAKCGHEFEALQKFSDAPIKTCPECKARKVQKKVSAGAFILKGSGWYQNDIARVEKKQKAEHLAKQSGTAEGKTDSKPEAKAESKSEPKAEGKADSKAEPKAEKKPVTEKKQPV